MIEAVIDTNVVISGLLGGSSTRPLINALIERKFKLVISYQLLEELFEVMARTKFRKQILPEDINELASLLEFGTRIVNPNLRVHDCRDSKDNIILECALEGRPDYVVSGDDDLLCLSPYHDIPIITVTQFLEKLGELTKL